VALLTGLHTLIVRAAAFAAGLLFLAARRSLLRIGILVALLAGFDVLFMGSTVGSHEVFSSRLMARPPRPRGSNSAWEVWFLHDF